MKDATELIKALTGLAWPLMAGLVLWRLFPLIKEIARSRGFTIKVGEAQLSVQEYSESLIRTTADIQGRLAAVGAPAAAHTLDSVLWVDDRPENNATEVAQLRELGVEVTSVKSTDEGLRALARARRPFGAVVSDLSRRERGRTHRAAGLELIRELRAQGDTVPVFVYATPRALAQRAEITGAGGDGVARSSTELFELLRGVGEFPARRS
ncbi:CheY chemotaxis protein or a CheY-like REC (receiver) domain [Streptomyces misionensis]|uniref:CheY chemotaxis protein or a CheY-like REC (Receiver) domain n=1 Tax=Streptomyces misionensis TaxID=67331 RepID=A0A1H4UMI5_9ACTN|nr:response regulator [Streptomyces misionensis]SEC69863.1 CheY chemotaxis protein or a CheY-like REC (receiver) domain [Streptomyces misionensis]